MWQSFSTQIILFKQKWRVKEYVLAVVSWSNRSDTSVFVKGEKTWQIREVKRSYGFQCAAFVLRPLLFEWAVFMSKRKNEFICFSSKTWIYCITYASPSHEQSHVPLSLSLPLSSLHFFLSHPLPLAVNNIWCLFVISVTLWCWWPHMAPLLPADQTGKVFKWWPEGHY